MSINTKKYLLTASDIKQMPADEITHFLNPNATRLNKSLGDAVGMKNMGFHLITVEPGKESTEYHKHHYEDEAVYVLSGNATLIIEGDSYTISQGDFIGLPCNKVAHTIINDSDETLECLVVGQRLAQDVADYPNQAKRLYRNSGSMNLVDFKSVQLPLMQSHRKTIQLLPTDIIEFWYSDNMRKSWFNSTPVLDFAIREKFEVVWGLALTGHFDDWRSSPEGCLALTILFDQLPLNMFRHQVKSFQTEQQAVAITKHAVKEGFDQQLDSEKRVFLYMPLMHSENNADQAQSVQLFETLAIEGNLRFAKHHRDIIKKFGRFPHRNAILGRESTAEEVEYLNSKQAFTG